MLIWRSISHLRHLYKTTSLHNLKFTELRFLIQTMVIQFRIMGIINLIEIESVKTTSK